MVWKWFHCGDVVFQTGGLVCDRTSRSLENWKNFKRVVKNVKRSYFNEKIQEIANKRKGP